MRNSEEKVKCDRQSEDTKPTQGVVPQIQIPWTHFIRVFKNLSARGNRHLITPA